ncbi:MAG: hypothetical protein ABFE13_19250 [Phycisphaerales bacterium]
MNARVDNRVRFCGSIILVFCVLVLVCACGRLAGAEELISPLEEISVFDLPEQAGQQFLMGQRSACGDKPDPNVAAYPKFASSQPIYGTADFSDPMGSPEDGKLYRFALDESAGTGKGYDRLYFDLNHDRNLTNDGVLTVPENPPANAMLGYSNLKQQACFENLVISFAFDSEGERLLEMMPRLTVHENGYKNLSLVTTKARKGRIAFAGSECDVLLGHCYIASGWFDQPYTALHLTPAGASRPWDWWGGDRLNAMHKVNGTFYLFSATPTGDKLIVRPYEGPMGTFEVGAGGRNIDQFEISGSLRSEKTAVALGDVSNDNQPVYTRSCRLPVGDYLLEYVNLQYGTLRINLSMNYHADGKRQQIKGRQSVYGIAIRADKPFVFDFSNKPDVMFASPARGHRARLGEEISVAAVLIDPIQDFMIRDLSDTSRKQEKESSGPNGTKYSYARDLSLDPKVTIARANGEIVAEGVMPFG